MRLGVCLHDVIVHAVSRRCAKRWMCRQPRPPCLLQASVASKTASWTFATCLFSRLRFLASQNVDVAALQWPWMVPCLRVLRRMKLRRSDEDVPMKTHLQSFVQMRLQSGFSARMAAKQLRTRRAVAHLHNGVSVTLRKGQIHPPRPIHPCLDVRKSRGEPRGSLVRRWDGSDRRYTLKQDTPFEVGGL